MEPELAASPVEVLQADAHALDADMRTSSDMLLGLHKRATTTEFACYVRNFTPAAISLTVPLGSAEREPRMTEDAYAALRERIRRQVASPLSEVDALIAAALPGAPMAHHAPTSFADEY